MCPLLFSKYISCIFRPCKRSYEFFYCFVICYVVFSISCHLTKAALIFYGLKTNGFLQSGVFFLLVSYYITLVMLLYPWKRHFLILDSLNKQLSITLYKLSEKSIEVF